MADSSRGSHRSVVRGPIGSVGKGVATVEMIHAQLIKRGKLRKVQKGKSKRSR